MRWAIGALMLGLLATPALAQWKWRDAKGSVQYSDRPPPQGVADKDILQRPPGSKSSAVVILPMGVANPASAAAASPAASTPAPKAVDPLLETRKRQADEAEQNRRRAEEEKVAKQRAENCQRAREYARTLESGVRVGRVEANGERVVLDDEARAKELAQAQRVIASECR